LTKGHANYDNNAYGMTFQYHNTLSLMNNSYPGIDWLNWFEGPSSETGNQWTNGLNAGAPVTLSSRGEGYVFA
jgi:hypothetical protein